MANTLPVLLALMVHLSGINIFRNLRTDRIASFDRCSTPIFTVAAYLFLLDIRLYPKRFRRLPPAIMLPIEFICGLYSLETILIDFWFPLENSFLSFILCFAKWLGPYAKNSELDCLIYLVRFLMSANAATLFSVFLSTFFLCSIGHATRACDFRLLTMGYSYFLKDVGRRSKKSFKRMLIFRNVAPPIKRCRRRSSWCGDY